MIGRRPRTRFSRHWPLRRGPILVLLFLLAPRPALSAPFSLILCGSGGEDPYVARFQHWGARLKAALADSLGHPRGNVRLLTETGAGPGVDGKSDLAAIRASFDALSGAAGPNDDLFLFLIGHGSYRGSAKLNIPGPDLSAEALGEMLRAVRARRTVLVNAASASAAFINVLGKEGRVLCTSTKSVEETNATRFMEFFIQSIEDGSADQDRDGRVAVLEACRQASALTAAWYTSEGLLATEHAILDDNGDRLGSRLVDDPEDPRRPARHPAPPDGDLASRTFLKDWTFPPRTPPEWVDAYLAALASVQSHIARKSQIEERLYWSTLESLLVNAARLHRRIRSGGGPDSP